MLESNPPNINGARDTARRIVRDWESRVRGCHAPAGPLQVEKKLPPSPIDLNDAVREVIALSLSELQGNRILVRHDLAENLPVVMGDRIQLQQVVLANLLRNASDAMRNVHDWLSNLLIKTESDVNRNVL